MDPRHATCAPAARQPWPKLDDDEESAPLEPWALDEIDSDFATPSAHLQYHRDAALE